MRFASTAPVSLPTVASTTLPPTEAAESSFLSLDNASDFTMDSILDMPETIGFLKNLGLDYGWGPTSVIQWVLEHVHVYAGTPWWASIILTAVVIRAAMFKGYMGASDASARMAAIKPLVEPLTAKMNAARISQDTEAVMQVRQELSLINKRAGVKFWKLGVPMLQIFTGYGTWKLLRGMSDLPLPGLEHGGMLWFYNLTIPDPLFLIPITTSLGMHWVIKVGVVPLLKKSVLTYIVVWRRNWRGGRINHGSGNA
jgi:YidC/Oxa1 family membrane protein insertase